MKQKRCFDLLKKFTAVGLSVVMMLLQITVISADSISKITTTDASNFISMTIHENAATGPIVAQIDADGSLKWQDGYSA